MAGEIVTMRKMSEKSVLHFGRWQNFTVGFLIGAGRSQYLAWVYYNYERITFLDEVLDKIGIRNDMRIEKPGKQPQKFNEYKARRERAFILSGATEKERYIRAARLKKNHKHAIKAQMAYERDLYSSKWGKAQLQWTNQGHAGSVFKG